LLVEGTLAAEGQPWSFRTKLAKREISYVKTR